MHVCTYVCMYVNTYVVYVITYVLRTCIVHVCVAYKSGCCSRFPVNGKRWDSASFRAHVFSFRTHFTAELVHVCMYVHTGERVSSQCTYACLFACVLRKIQIVYTNVYIARIFSVPCSRLL